jgi:hypothetical protein
MIFPVPDIYAPATDRAHTIGQHFALVVERKLGLGSEIAAVGATQKFVGPIAAPAQLLVQLHGRISDDTVFRIEAGLLAEAAPHIADEHAHALLRPLQDLLGQEIAGRTRRLRLHVKQEAPGLLLDLGDRRARLHRGWN